MKETVMLKKPHTHAKKDYEPGETIEVNELDAEWLVLQGVGTVLSGEGKAVVKNAAAAGAPTSSGATTGAQPIAPGASA